MKSGVHSIYARIAMLASPGHRRAGFVALIVLASILLCGATAPTVGTVVLVEVHHSSHTIEGCVSASPNGLEVRNLKDNKIYSLAGATASTKVGDIVRLHGDKEKATKDDQAADSGDPTFVVQKVTRDFGPCKLSASAVTSTGSPSEIQDAQ